MWWSNPLGYVLMVYLSYKAYQMIWITRKQKKGNDRPGIASSLYLFSVFYPAAQLVAFSYGQGGQWLNPVPR